MSAAATIKQFQELERAEREAAANADNDDDRDLHIIEAERYADQAWSLNEADDALPAIESGLWGACETLKAALPK